jgi:molybdopterin molybdotransferase
VLSFTQAREKVVEIVRGLVARAGRAPAAERVELAAAFNRVLAERVRADRDYPAFHRATRDGFALRSADVAAVPATLAVVAEIKAGDAFRGEIGPGQCVQIMTGAAVPPGADAVVMIEHTRLTGKQVVIERAAAAGQNIVASGSEARQGQMLLEAGARLGYAELAILAQVGHSPVGVYRRPHVAILSTGDEVVDVGAQPGPFQIRNSNSVSLAAQIALAGGEPVTLGNSPDRAEVLRERIARGLEEDALVLSGGVSVGKYDLVETVLRELGAEFFFDAVAIRPGRPAAFGVCRGKPVFGLPGNPVSTMVTCELFVLPALDLLGGAPPRPLTLLRAKLARAIQQKALLTHFLPAQITWEGGEPVVRELPWQGSGDIVALAQANCFLVVHAEKLEMCAGEWADVLPRRGTF